MCKSDGTRKTCMDLKQFLGYKILLSENTSVSILLRKHRKKICLTLLTKEEISTLSKAKNKSFFNLFLPVASSSNPALNISEAAPPRY